MALGLSIQLAHLLKSTCRLTSQTAFFTLNQQRNLAASARLRCEESGKEEQNNGDATKNSAPVEKFAADVRYVPKKRTLASKAISPETSIRYMGSKAYKETYGDKPIWVPFRRNFKGTMPPSRTRLKCIHKGAYLSGSPCPICRDEYLVIHYTNVKLLEQFICRYSGVTFPVVKTGVCRQKQFELLVAIELARDYGLISVDVPFRKFDYKEYYPHLKDASVYDT